MGNRFLGRGRLLRPACQIKDVYCLGFKEAKKLFKKGIKG